MTTPDPIQIVLTPEQRQLLGQVYQLILSWRRERLLRAGEPSAKAEDGTPAPVRALPVPSSDSEA